MACLALLAVSLVRGVGPAFGGFVGSAQTTATISVDTLDHHLSVAVPPSGGRLELHNPTAATQDVALTVVDGSAVAYFASTHTGHASVPPGGDDSVELLDSSANPTGGKVAVSVVQPGGSLFPSAAYTVLAP